MTKEQDFKQRFAAVLRDLQQNGSKDPGAMVLLGSLAADLSRDLHTTNWTQAKAVMTPATYDALLGKLQQEGNALHAEGKVEHTYVIQALAVSLVAGTQRADPDMVSGEKLLDHLIDSAIVLYRAQPKPS
ncbi:MAG TPA: hypothetical protein VL147_13965 [Devosia sp.]|nr:hypothetical protein [Devosia sp.]